MTLLRSMRRRRVRFKQQMADADCGAACLAMILSYYGRETSVDSARKDCELHGPPQSSRSIVLAARAQGLNADLFSADLPALAAVAAPCILFWNFSHFVVYVRAVPHGFEIVDPWLGRRIVPGDEFNTSYTGIGIQFSKGAAFIERSHDRNTNFRRYLLQALGTRPVWRSAAFVLACSAALQLISLALPLTALYLVDQIIPAGLREAMWPLLAIIVLLAANIGLTTYLRGRVIAHLQMAVDKSLLDGFMLRLLRLPVGFFFERSVGDLQSRLNATTVVRDWMSSYSLSSVLDIFTVITFVAVIAFVSPAFALLTACLGALQFAIYPLLSNDMLEKASAEMRTQASYQSYLIEVLNGVATIKGAAAEAEAKRVWDVKLHNYLVCAKNRSHLDAAVSSYTATIVAITPVLLFWFSVIEHFHGRLTLGAVVSLNALSNMALAPLSSLVRMLRYGHVLRTHLERLGDVWRQDVEESGTEKAPTECRSLSIVFGNVSFRYKSARADALCNLNVEIPLSKKIGIVGPSGSGKTTFLSLLLGFYRPSQGSIRLGTRDIWDYDMATWRRQLGYVLQNTFVFNSSIRNNIAMANPGASLEEVQWAARCAGLDRDVEMLPMGYNTIVGESGVSLSGGQRQRLSIARAIIKKPSILIFDEATSSLDSLTEDLVASNIANLDCAQILVSHRLSTVRHCDVILVFEKGSIVATGTHDELMASSAFYRSCVGPQAQQYSAMPSDRAMNSAPFEREKF